MKTFEFKIESVKLTAESTGNTIDLSWNVSKGCHGYHIQYSTDATFTEDVKVVQIFNTNTLSHTLSNLKAGTYYIRIAAYKTIDQQKCFSDWSEAAIITVDW